MNKEQSSVLEFHKAFDQYIGKFPTVDIPQDVINLRIELIEEELQELKDGIEEHDIIKIADALADLKYVVDGAGIAFGIDLEPIFAEVHRSNMTKVGGHKREDGKWIKPNDYEPPDILGVIAEQICSK